MADFTEVTHESWFSRIANSIKGIAVGFVLIAAAFILLFWNEGQSARRFKTLKEGIGSVVPVGADRVDPSNEGKLVHLSGDAVTDGYLFDRTFGVSSKSIRLKRDVEMYQWQEKVSTTTRKKLGGGEEKVKSYDYVNVWSGSVIDSSGFKESDQHANPADLKIPSKAYAAKKVNLGTFRLSDQQINLMNNFEVLIPATVSLEMDVDANFLGEYLHIGRRASDPQVGDLRVRFSVVKPGSFSVVARQTGDSFEPYTTKNGGSIFMIEPGTHSAEAMFNLAKGRHKALVWFIRGLGFALFFIGLSLLLKPLSVLADVVPFLGSLVAAGTGLIALAISAVLWLTTVSVAWIVYRPLLGILLLLAAGGLVYALKAKLFRRKGPTVAAGVQVG